MPLGYSCWALCLECCVSLSPLRRRNLGWNRQGFYNQPPVWEMWQDEGWERWACPWCQSMMQVWPLVKRRPSSLGESCLDCCTVEGRFRKAFGESQSPKVSTVLPLLCSVIGQVQPIGSGPLAQTLGWISEVAAQLCTLSLEAFLLASVSAFPLALNSSCLYLKDQL